MSLLRPWTNLLRTSSTLVSKVGLVYPHCSRSVSTVTGCNSPFQREGMYSGEQKWKTNQSTHVLGSEFLSFSFLLIPHRGYKVKAFPKRRCKDCYQIWIEGSLHNLCKTHGRHKQRQKPPYFSNMRIISGVSQAVRIPW